MGWKDEYKRAMVRFLLKQGTPVDREHRSAYGYIASDWSEQRDAIARLLDDPEFDYDRVRIEESEWSDFVGTFDGWRDRHGVDAFVDIDGRTYQLRYDGTLQQVMFGVLNDEEG